MALPAIIAAAGSTGLRATLGGIARKVGGWLFGTKLRTALTAFTAGTLFTGNSSAGDSAAAAQVRNYRA